MKACLCEFHLVYRYHDQYPCPKGYYRNETQGMSVDDCYPCPGGQYCEYQGLFEPTGECDEGKLTVTFKTLENVFKAISQCNV